MSASWIFRLLALLVIMIGMTLPPEPGALGIHPAVAMELSPVTDTANGLVPVMLRGDFDRAGKMLADLHGDFRRIHQALEHQAYNERKQRELAVMHMWLREIELAIRNQSAIGGAIAANQLTAALIRYRNFPDKVHTSIEWLGYLAREIELLNIEDAEGNAGLLELRRNDAGATWRKLRTHLLKNLRNKTLVMQIDTLLRRIDADVGQADQVENARKLQQWVAKIVVSPAHEGAR